MIILNSQVNNEIFLTLSQDTLLSGLTSSYTLNIYSQQQSTPYTISLTAISSTTRYEEFIVSGASLTGLTDGYYDYSVYNSAYSATTLEVGKCLISGNSINQKSIDSGTNNNKLIDNRA